MKKALAVVTVLVLVFVLVGFLLPGDYRVERAALVPFDRATTFATAADLSTWPRWCAWSAATDPTCRYEFEDREGAGARVMEWQGAAHGHGRLELTRPAAPEQLDYTLTFFRGDQVVRSTGTIRFESEGDGTRVTWLLVGHMPREPVQRWVGLMMDGALGPVFEKSLAGLAAELAVH